MVLLKFENNMDREISDFNHNSNKYKSAMELTRLLTVFNLFPLEVVKKCQLCQLCVLRENSNVTGYEDYVLSKVGSKLENRFSKHSIYNIFTV